MFVVYEIRGDDSVEAVWMGSERVELWRRVTDLFTQEKTFSAVDNVGGKETTLAYGHEASDGYRTFTKEHV